MRLAELFTGEKSIAEKPAVEKTNADSGRNNALNRQIHSLIPGQTVHGEVVARSGGEVQIRLADDTVLQAKLDRNLNLEVGKNVTFEVKNNGRTLTLSPLFTNTATDANAMKALDMASLPLNGSTADMARQMMEAGLPIDRNTLQEVFREMTQFPRAKTEDIINLHKLHMPVNEANVTQMASYRNLTHQLMTGLNQVLDAVPEAFAQLLENGDASGAAALYEQLVLFSGETEAFGEALGLTGGDAGAHGEALGLTGGDVGAPDGTTVMSGGETGAPDGTTVMPGGEAGTPDGTTVTSGGDAVVPGETPDLPDGQSGTPDGVTGPGGEESKAFHGTTGLPGGETAMSGKGTEAMQGENRVVIAETAEEMAPRYTAAEQSGGKALPEGGGLSGQNGIPNQATGFVSAETLARLMSQTTGQNVAVQTQLDGLLKPLLQMLKKQWTVTPEEVADADRVEGLYRRLDKQLKSLAQTLENTGQNAGAAYKAVTGLTQNLDFLQQVNQAYAYVQLPLRLQQGEAHGDLYVYTNKRHLAQKDGQISALLHLDMEHLGPVDVYVAMTNENVNTRFYVQDDEMLDFLTGHMDILTNRLEKRGYQCSFEMKVKEQGERKESVVGKLLGQENAVPLAEYSFDVRT